MELTRVFISDTQRKTEHAHFSRWLIQGRKNKEGGVGEEDEKEIF